eukprot:CAMPEP_0117028770 /NCGR_PEP_ID=MMETSP0472-20121206/20892_1 /TAXON_ID=693140 ORGANISM="Tiarina fusus, Strain LIS" /NCGR_SAMPLE_ID=MMETSP0472 /ASSEMBLY_ACC=CAM_ASM_000603 /LENGTH=208 /DNA_ID=CAMNT_0004736355 /DNA_START=266 /DNA_END=892 /DNA_ORIENTATION=+
MNFIDRFTTVIPKAINTFMREAEPSVQAKVTRLISIWRDRQVIPEATLNQITSLPPEVIKTTPKPTPKPEQTKKPATVAPKKATVTPDPIPPRPKNVLPKSLEKIAKLTVRLNDKEADNLLAEDNLSSSATANIFPWTPEKKHQLNGESSLSMLADVRKTLSAANDLKERMEKDLKNRAELVTLLNQLKDKQEVILASNIGKLQVRKI